MSNRTGCKKYKTATQEVFELDFLIAMASGTTGVIAANGATTDSTTKTRLPKTFLTASRISAGLVRLVLADGYYAVASGHLSLINSGTALADTTLQWSKALPWSLTSASSTIDINVVTVSTGALVDPAAAYGIMGTLRLKVSSVLP